MKMRTIDFVCDIIHIAGIEFKAGHEIYIFMPLNLQPTKIGVQELWPR